METAEIKRRWLRFFGDRGHTVVPSASLLLDDPNLLFVNAGMVPFKPYLLGQETPPWKRATSVQKCVRTLDIEEVGKTTRHGTFFQMNGNFSFGDYFKEGAIELAWELVTGAQDDGFFGFDPDTVWVTVLENDDEAARLWRKVAGLPEERIQRRGLADNYWHMGVPGPGGPASEIYIDRGPEHGPEGGPVVDEDRFLEIWNLVFMQEDLSAVRSKVDFDVRAPLPTPNIDTGLGLERVAYLLQGVDNLYEIDEVFPVLDRAAALAGKQYGSSKNPNDVDDVRLRVVADHVRSAMMLINDGVTPGNETRGYVLRRLLRRTVRSMRLLGYEDPVLPELLPISRDAMAPSYPELASGFGRISQLAYAEEETFRGTLRAGTTILDTAVSETKTAGGSKLSGERAFQLHDTYGFPIDLTLEMAAEQGLSVDEEGFRRLMREQRERAQADSKAKKSGHADLGAYRSIVDSGGTTILHGLRRGRHRRQGRRGPRQRRVGAGRPPRAGGRARPRPHPVLRRGRRPARRPGHDPAGQRRRLHRRRRPDADARCHRAPRPGHQRRGRGRRRGAQHRRRRAPPVDQPRPHRDPPRAPCLPRRAGGHRHAGRLGERAGPLPLRLLGERRRAAERPA